MQYLNLKPKAQLLKGAFCLQASSCCLKHSFSEHFEALHTGKDGLRWVTFSAENVGQLISYYYISGKLEHIYLETQQGGSVKNNGPKHMEGDDARWRNAG